MIAPRLESISITDFRSIKGSITVPLNAPVVLIHGANGTGKTSILSALELALTGEVDAFRRSDVDYFANLPHRDATEARIALSTSGGSDGAQAYSMNMIVSRNGPQNQPLFDASTARFFEERCYLAQSTLGRLLEIYQHADSKNTESPLTRFVKDVLGLDQLDAVIEGLYAAENITRVRKLVVTFRDTENVRSATNKRLDELKKALGSLQESVLIARRSFSEMLPLLPEVIGLETSSIAPDELESRLATDPEEQALIALAGVRRTLASLRADWNSIATSPEAEQRLRAETETQAASSALKKWREEGGARLEAVIERLRSIFPDIPSLASTDPQTAIRTTDARLTAELNRCNNQLSQDDFATSHLAIIEQTIARGRARIAIIDAQISELAIDAASLSQVLATLVPHVHSDTCPVCERDFSEVSKVPLVVRLSSRVSQLTEKGDRIQALSTARSEVVGAATLAERERESVALLRVPQETRVALKARTAELLENRQKLEALKDVAEIGNAILRADAQAKGRLAQLQERDRQTTAISLVLNQLFTDLAPGELKVAEPVAKALDTLEGYLKIRELSLAEIQSTRRRALSEYGNLRKDEQRLRSLQDESAELSLVLEQLNKAFDAAERCRHDARRIAAAARKARSTIVSRVFNDSLNAVWRDLFVRLAPTEPFVPAFKLPETADGPIVAALETIHRAGGRGGTPGAMLSAGNLNTAALTLFLALHLSVSIRLPWLILDDPVQSMDEVHVSQFAALLRTLSKGHHRQIVIAVHDRALFDYLSLELSPAFPDDQLITLELGRSDRGASLAEPAFRLWEPDKAVAVG